MTLIREETVKLQGYLHKRVNIIIKNKDLA